MKQKVLPILFCFAILIFISCNDEEIFDTDIVEEVASTEAFQVAKLNITTENAAAVTSRETYVNCTVSIKSDKAEWNYSGTGMIRGRGNSSWLWYPKKPYRIKLDNKAGILGLKEDKDWVLLADYRDPTHLMNTFTFTVGQGLNFPAINHSRYVEVTLNNDYVGIYLLTEQVEQGKNRVAIDSTTGVLLSLDADDGPDLTPGAGDNFWSSVYQMPVCVKSPEITSSAQLTNFKTEFAVLENAIRNANYNELSELLDIPVFIDYMIIQELVYNVEVDAPRSIFLYKDNGKKWTMGPLWDFDAGFDFDWSTMYTGHNYFYSYKQLVLGTSPANHTGGYNVPSFFSDMFKNKQFVAEYKARWVAVKDKIMSEYWVTTQSYVEGFSSAMVRETARWPIDKYNKTEIQNMQLWLSNRVSYLTMVIDNYPEGTK